MTDVEKRALVDRYLEAYNAFDLDAMGATLHPDVSFENVAGGAVTASADGVDAFRALAERAAALFASRRQTVTAFRSTEGGAVAEVDYEGTLAQSLPGGPAAGETIRLRGRAEFTFRDGRIVRVVDRS